MKMRIFIATTTAVVNAVEVCSYLACPTTCPLGSCPKYDSLDGAAVRLALNATVAPGTSVAVKFFFDASEAGKYNCSVTDTGEVLCPIVQLAGMPQGAVLRAQLAWQQSDDWSPAVPVLVGEWRKPSILASASDTISLEAIQRYYIILPVSGLSSSVLVDTFSVKDPLAGTFIPTEFSVSVNFGSVNLTIPSGFSLGDIVQVAFNLTSGVEIATVDVGTIVDTPTASSDCAASATCSQRSNLATPLLPITIEGAGLNGTISKFAISGVACTQYVSMEDGRSLICIQVSNESQLLESISLDYELTVSQTTMRGKVADLVADVPQFTAVTPWSILYLPSVSSPYNFTITVDLGAWSQSSVGSMELRTTKSGSITCNCIWTDSVYLNCSINSTQTTLSQLNGQNVTFAVQMGTPSFVFQSEPLFFIISSAPSVDTPAQSAISSRARQLTLPVANFYPTDASSSIITLSIGVNCIGVAFIESDSLVCNFSTFAGSLLDFHNISAIALLSGGISVDLSANPVILAYPLQPTSFKFDVLASRAFNSTDAVMVGPIYERHYSLPSDSIVFSVALQQGRRRAIATVSSIEVVFYTPEAIALQTTFASSAPAAGGFINFLAPATNGEFVGYPTGMIPPPVAQSAPSSSSVTTNQPNSAVAPLTSGAIAGIVIASILAVVVLLVTVTVLMKHRHSVKAVKGAGDFRLDSKSSLRSMTSISMSVDNSLFRTDSFKTDFNSVVIKGSDATQGSSSTSRSPSRSRSGSEDRESYSSTNVSSSTGPARSKSRQNSSTLTSMSSDSESTYNASSTQYSGRSRSSYNSRSHSTSELGAIRSFSGALSEYQQSENYSSSRSSLSSTSSSSSSSSSGDAY